MTGFNYRWHRSRLKIPEISILPEGKWRTVGEAAFDLGVSEGIIRIWYLKKEIKACYLKGYKRIILVDISEKSKKN